MKSLTMMKSRTEERLDLLDIAGPGNAVLMELHGQDWRVSIVPDPHDEEPEDSPIPYALSE